MAKVCDKKAILSESLKDIGCEENFIACCRNLMDEKNQEALIQELMSLRKIILNNIHSEEFKLDCLDVLIYKLQKKNLI
ncbi:MAG: hypothetical protein Q4D21_02390 [Phascolarctobacterium sp.]|nr:hypothetical protein [Phascolarctobacterium sp.]